jgi:hypothetical protein
MTVLLYPRRPSASEGISTELTAGAAIASIAEMTHNHKTLPVDSAAGQ